MAERDEALSTDSDVTVKPPRRRRTLIGAALGVAVLVALVLPGISTLQPGYYSRYPDLRDRMDHWEVSTHGRMGCIDCHVEPGIKGHLLYGVKSVPAFYSQLIQGPKKTNLLGEPSSEACQQCHTSYRRVSPDGDLLIPHRAHVEVLGVNCVDCHTDLVHTENEKGFNRPTMVACLDACHDGTQATEECIKCHTRKHTPETHAKADWLQVHGVQTDTTNCAECHEWTPDYCNDCHKERPSTHVGNWKKGHQFRASDRGQGCTVCHAEKFCKDCH